MQNGFLAPYQNLNKLMIQFHENAHTEGQKDVLFHMLSCHLA